MSALTAQTTQRSGGLLALARSALNAAQAEYSAACNAYEYSHSRADKEAWLTALGNLQRVKSQYQQAYEQATARKFTGVV